MFPFRASFLLSCAIFALSSSWQLSATTNLVLGCGLPQKDPMWPRVEEYLVELNKQLKDVQIAVKYVPFSRIPDLMSKKKIDGDLGRTKLIYADNPAVVAVEESITSLEMVFVSNADDNFKSIEEIRQYKTAAELGNLFMMRICKEKQLDCIFVGTGSEVIKMLRLKRVRTLMTSRIKTQAFFESVDDPKNFQISPAYYSEPVYLFLRKEWAHVRENFNEALRALKSNGTNKRLFGTDA